MLKVRMTDHNGGVESIPEITNLDSRKTYAGSNKRAPMLLIIRILYELSRRTVEVGYLYPCDSDIFIYLHEKY